ncbi:hypothetical protein V492_00969 [Pseudogymnoascus sp. VKM F-4246]|nr:hypothetical protein V492_00969 [Pseudogymnoascus sp. VKM F-4246]
MSGCEAMGLPFTLDVEKVCGVKLTITSAATETPTPSVTGDSTKASTPGSSTKGTSEAASEGSVTPVPNSVPQAAVIFNGAAILVATFAMLLL